MSGRHRLVVIGLVVVPAALITGCRADSDDALAPSAPTAPSGTRASDESDPAASTTTVVPSSESSSQLGDPNARTGPTLPVIGGGATGDDAPAWLIDTPGASTVVDDGVLEIDPRGTHEWVRATTDAPGADAGVVVRFETPEPVEGSMFVGMLGDGEWADAAPYQQQTGVAVEYGFAALHDGEITLILAGGGETTRIGPVLGPVLGAGDAAFVRLQVVEDVAQVRVWAVGEPEPSAWALRATLPRDNTGGSIHVSFRGAAGERVAIREVRLEPPVT